MDLRSEVGRNVRMLRRDVRGWTTTQLAGGVGISRSYLEKIESGRRDPSVGFCERAARLLGVKLMELVDRGAAGGDGAVLETVARLRGLGMDPKTLSAWLARRPPPLQLVEDGSPGQGRTADSPEQEETGMKAKPGNRDPRPKLPPVKARNEFAVVLGRRITRFRRKLRPVMSQDTLARRLGVTRKFVQKLECGLIDLPISIAARAASVFRVPVSSLICGDKQDAELEEWHRVALEACRAFQGMGMKPSDALPSVRWLTHLLASYVRKGAKRR